MQQEANKVVLRRERCDSCALRGGDTKQDNKIVYADGHTYCNACSNYTNANKKTEKTMERKITNLLPGVFKELKDRGISQQTCEKYNVRIGRAKNKEVVIYPIYDQGKVVKQKLRNVDDKNRQTQLGDTSCMKLFGQNLFSPSKNIPITITEGEFDAMCVHQATGYPAVSGVRGANGILKEIQSNLEWLSQWKFITLCLDQDEAGQEAANKIIETLEPGSVRVAHLPLKDANDMLLAGRGEEIKKCLFNAEIIKPPTLVSPIEIKEKILAQPEYGSKWPWDSMTRATYGLRWGETYLLAAAAAVGKCLAPDTPVIMYDGSVKCAKDVSKNDVLMGPDSKPRNVLSTVSGRDTMYKVTPVRGDSYTVNSEHILTLSARITRGPFVRGNLYDISVKEYLSLSDYYQKNLFSVRSGEIAFPEQEVLFDPYLYGLWLGDGHKHSPSITTGDDILCEYISNFTMENGLSLSEYPEKGNCRRLNIVTRGRKYNPFLSFISSSVCENKKYIRKEYLVNSSSIRLQLLAGLIDTDGYLSPTNCFELTTVSKTMSENILFLARSLGLMATCADKIVKDKKYYRINITGDIHKIPTKLVRKQAAKKDNNSLTCRINVEKLLVSDYCGFVIDGDKRFLLGDFQITHNTEFMREIVSQQINNNIKCALFSFEQTPEDTMRRFIGAELGVRLHIPDPERQIRDSRIESLVEKLNDNVLLYNHSSGNLSFEQIVINIRYAARCFGTKFFVLDNLKSLSVMPFVEGKVVSDIVFMSHVMATLAKICRELNITIFVITHVNTDRISMSYQSGSESPLNREGLRWETGRVPTLENIYGGGKISDLVDYVLVLSRNRVSEDKDKRSITHVKFLKTRLDSTYEGFTFDLRYEYNSGRLKELDKDIIK